MHWFDRFSEGIATAADVRTSRRTLVKGAALATVALPFAPDGLAYATNRVNQRIAESECLNCFSFVTKEQNRRLAACAAASGGGTAGIFSHALLRPKGGGSSPGGSKPSKKNKTIKPAEAPVEISCQARSELMFLGALETCRVKTCSLHPPGPAPAPGGGGSATPGGGGSGCSPGTTQCGATLGCYGGDSCCPCTTVEGGLICCAAVIGCTCCG
jgi:hypothetical protein